MERDAPCNHGNHGGQHTIAECRMRPVGPRPGYAYLYAGQTGATRTTSKGGGDAATIKCYNCKEMGHYAGDCENPAAGNLGGRNTAAARAKKLRDAATAAEAGLLRAPEVRYVQAPQYLPAPPAPTQIRYVVQQATAPAPVPVQQAPATVKQELRQPAPQMMQVVAPAGYIAAPANSA